MDLLKNATDKSFWEKVRTSDSFAKHRAELTALWEKHCSDGSIAAITYSDFKLYWITGDRAMYEKKYFSRRLALDCSALLSLIYPEEEKYLTHLMNVIYTICDEYTWCLPAHQKKLEPNNNSVIDLFAAETAFALSEVYTILKDRLEPLIKNRINAEIDRRIISSFESKEPYSWWETSPSNWNAVCTGSVACTVMLMRPELFDKFKPRFDKAIEYYLDGFKDDGVCVEGCGYWHYGFGFFTVYADMVRNFTNGKTDYFKREKVKTVSTFIQKVFLSGRCCVSFADAGRNVSYHLGLLHYLKNEYPSDIVIFDPQYSYNYDNCGRFCLQLRSFTWLSEDYLTDFSSSAEQEVYADGTEWFIKTTESYGFAAKGGHNKELHNHNDIGSFIFAKNGRQVLMDMGTGVYTRQYFGSERYTILDCSSRGHSVPIINGQYQLDGEKYAARETKYENGDFSTDIAGAYECEGLESIKRSFSFTDSSVKMKDVFVYTGGGEITERITTPFAPEVCENGMIKVAEVSLVYDPSVCSLNISSEKRQNGERCFFIDLTLADGVREFKCEIK